MVEERRAELKRVCEEAWNKGNLDVLDELFADDFVYHRGASLPDIEGLEAAKQTIVDFRSAFPDIQETFDEIIIEGDRSATRWTARGTHTGQLPGLPIPPTGKQVTLVGCTVRHFVGGKCVEQWEYADLLGFMQQLGVIPTPGQD